MTTPSILSRMTAKLKSNNMNAIKIFSNRLTPILTAAVVAGIGIGALLGADNSKILFKVGLVFIVITVSLYFFLKRKI